MSGLAQIWGDYPSSPPLPLAHRDTLTYPPLAAVAEKRKRGSEVLAPVDVSSASCMSSHASCTSSAASCDASSDRSESLRSDLVKEKTLL